LNTDGTLARLPRATFEFANVILTIHDASPYRDADVLLIDDVQFLASKVRTEEEFFHAFNALYESGRQLVLTCDRLPRSLIGIEARLRERFEAGLVAEMNGAMALVLSAPSDRRSPDPRPMEEARDFGCPNQAKPWDAMVLNGVAGSGARTETSRIADLPMCSS
jgi:hypothetical protein